MRSGRTDTPETPVAAPEVRRKWTVRRSLWYGGSVRVTRYFAAMRARPDRAAIRDEWIERAVREPIREQVQADGRIRRWVQVSEAEGRYLRVVLLSDGETVHNAFFDRGFTP
jgi:hypothetical protein